MVPGFPCRLSTATQSLLPQAWQGRPPGNLCQLVLPNKFSQVSLFLSKPMAFAGVPSRVISRSIGHQLNAALSLTQVSSLHLLRQTLFLTQTSSFKPRNRRRSAFIQASVDNAHADDDNSRASGSFKEPGYSDIVRLPAESCSPWVSWEAKPVVYSSPTGVQRNPSLVDRLPPPRLSVAPMMEYTDAHFRQLARLLSRHAWLYTEMVVDNTLLHQQPHLDKWLEFPACQHPLVLQLGGSEVAALAQAARLSDAYGYDEINLNCGCPSSAVAGHGCFGARLMLDPERVGDAVSAMAAACSVPVTVKCRIGVDDHDSYEELCEFVGSVADRSPVRHFSIHARKALLKGLSPAQNRTVPPLRYEYVAALVRDFPHLHFTLNGGILSLSEAVDALAWGVHGVMIGRAAYKNPWAILGDADRAIYGVPNRAVSRRQVLEEYAEYAEGAKERYGPHRPSLRALTMPLLSLFHSEPGGANWRRALEAAVRNCSTVQEILDVALPVLPDSVLDAAPGPPAGAPTRLATLGSLPHPPSRSSLQRTVHGQDLTRLPSGQELQEEACMVV